MKVDFEVIGTPKQAGSKRAFTNKATGKAMLVDMCKNQDWQADVKRAAHGSCDEPALGGPLSISVEFRFPRPKKHYDSKGNLRPEAPTYMAHRPDLDKLLRCLLDAMTGIIYADDGQVAVIHATKMYADRNQAEGATVRVEAM